MTHKILRIDKQPGFTGMFEFQYPSYRGVAWPGVSMTYHRGFESEISGVFTLYEIIRLRDFLNKVLEDFK